MPVRSLSSSVFAWPGRREVEENLTRWARQEAARRPDLVRVGFFGSYARNAHGVGSDLDVVIVVGNTDIPKSRRPLEWDLSALPVPADLIVFTSKEWEELQGDERRFARVLKDETVWVYGRT